MAGIVAGSQFAAIARVRWQLFQNSLRTTRGALEVTVRIIVTIWVAFTGIAGGTGLGFAAWYLTAHMRTGWLAGLLWGVFLFCQTFPVLSSAFTANLDSSNLLRFPLTFRSYFLIRMAYGAMEPATLLGLLWILGIGVGIAVANVALLPWAALVLLIFAVENILLARLIFTWIEKWLAKRRTREILSVVFFVFIMAMQFIGPAVDRYGKRPGAGTVNVALGLAAVQRFLPPGVAGTALSAMLRGKVVEALLSFAILSAYGLAFLWILNRRLLAQYHGENLSEGSRASSKEKTQFREGWSVPGLSESTAAVFEKELRYYFRSWPLMFNLVTPVFVLLLIMVSHSAQRGSPFGNAPSFAVLPIAAAYGMLALTNVIYNNFGGDHGGVQFFFVSPARMSSVVLAKNLAHTVLFVIEILLVYLGVVLLSRPPGALITLVTLAGVLYALPLNLGAGNLLSVYFPRKVDYSTFGRQRASQVSGLLSLGIQVVIFGTGALVVFISYRTGNLWFAVLAFLFLACLAVAVYQLILNKIGALVAKRREVLTAELCKE
jgi:ABC-2 type transport system permease protein